MGIYVYSMRKATTPIEVDGEKHIANIFDYAYKVSNNSWYSEDKAYMFRARNTDYLANKAFDHARSLEREYVVVGDSIYKDVKNPIWYDTGDFPATYVGKVGEV